MQKKPFFLDFLKETHSKSPINAEDFLATTTTTVFAKGLFSLVQCVSQFASSDSSGVVVLVARKSSAFMGDLLCVCFRKSKKNGFFCIFMQNR